MWWKRRLSGKIKPFYHAIIVVRLGWSLFHSSARPSFLPSFLPPLPSSYHKFEAVNVSIKTGCGVLFHRMGLLMSWYKSALKSVYFAFALLFLWHSSSRRLVCCGFLLSFVAANESVEENVTKVCKSADDVTCGWWWVESAESSSRTCRQGGLIKRGKYSP